MVHQGGIKDCVIQGVGIAWPALRIPDASSCLCHINARGSGIAPAFWDDGIAHLQHFWEVYRKEFFGYCLGDVGQTEVMQKILGCMSHDLLSMNWRLGE